MAVLLLLETNKTAISSPSIHPGVYFLQFMPGVAHWWYTVFRFQGIMFQGRMLKAPTVIPRASIIDLTEFNMFENKFEKALKQVKRSTRLYAR